MTLHIQKNNQNFKSKTINISEIKIQNIGQPKF